MRVIILFILISLTWFGDLSGQSKRVLFIGNSYTYENNLPQLLASLAATTGDTLIHDSSTPGGYTFMGHCSNATTLSKIAAGNWDVVVLQEQSQLPSFPLSQVNTQVLPYAKRLDSLVKIHNPCAETMFYMTWGRKNGDASNCSNWPPVCTYKGMDSLLQLRYRMMADSNNALISPVAAVWRLIRQNQPSIELYQPDQSHPSLAGSYAAACSFYAAIFRKNPALITTDAGLPAADAATIRNAARTVVYDSLAAWHIGEYDPKAVFSYQIAGNQVNFTNASLNADSFAWSFGDNSSSALSNPQHLYAQPGTYTVTLKASRCGRTDTASLLLHIQSTGIAAPSELSAFRIFPQPAGNELFIDAPLFPLLYTISDAGARQLKKGRIAAPEEALPVQDLETGIYFLEILKPDGSSCRYRFIKLAL